MELLEQRWCTLADVCQRDAFQIDDDQLTIDDGRIVVPQKNVTGQVAGLDHILNVHFVRIVGALFDQHNSGTGFVIDHRQRNRQSGKR